MPLVTFKICSRCKFRAPVRKSACTTCGSTTFAGEIVLDMPGKDADADGRAGGDAGSSALLPHPIKRAPIAAPASASGGADNVCVIAPEREGSSLGMLESSRPRDIQFADGIERPRVNTLREKFSVDPEEHRPHWFDESWTAIKRTFNL